MDANINRDVYNMLLATETATCVRRRQSLKCYTYFAYFKMADIENKLISGIVCCRNIKDPKNIQLQKHQTNRIRVKLIESM